jgi:hypothetical protein
MTIWNPLYENTALMCLLGGQFTSPDVSVTGKLMGNFIILAGGEFGSPSPPCTKQASTSGAIPNCATFLPSQTFSLFPKFDGELAVVNFSLQMAKENMIPAFTYLPPPPTGGTAPSGEPRVM